MTAIDWQQVFRDAPADGWLCASPFPSTLLAIRVPQACPTCDGSGIRRYTDYLNGYIVGATEPCPDCPTVAKLLAIGAAVMHGIDGSPPDANHVNQDWWIEGWEDAQIALRAVEP
jgi:hypothetical protein